MSGLLLLRKNRAAFCATRLNLKVKSSLVIWSPTHAAEQNNVPFFYAHPSALQASGVPQPHASFLLSKVRSKDGELPERGEENRGNHQTIEPHQNKGPRTSMKYSNMQITETLRKASSQRNRTFDYRSSSCLYWNYFWRINS